MNAAILKFDGEGNGHCLYTELIDLRQLGHLQISRASTIEFNNQKAEWEVKDMNNQLLFQNPSRSVCLAWEQQHLTP